MEKGNSSSASRKFKSSNFSDDSQQAGDYTLLSCDQYLNQEDGLDLLKKHITEGVFSSYLVKRKYVDNPKEVLEQRKTLVFWERPLLWMGLKKDDYGIRRAQDAKVRLDRAEKIVDVLEILRDKILGLFSSDKREGLVSYGITAMLQLFSKIENSRIEQKWKEERGNDISMLPLSPEEERNWFYLKECISQLAAGNTLSFFPRNQNLNFSENYIEMPPRMGK